MVFQYMLSTYARILFLYTSYIIQDSQIHMMPPRPSGTRRCNRNLTWELEVFLSTLEEWSDSNSDEFVKEFSHSQQYEFSLCALFKPDNDKSFCGEEIDDGNNSCHPMHDIKHWLVFFSSNIPWVS